MVLKADGIRDYAGNAIARDYLAVFTTASRPVVEQRETNRWPLSSDLVDLIGSNNGQLPNARFIDSSLSLTANSGGVVLNSSDVSSVLGGNATISFRIRTQQKGNNSPWLAPGLFGRDQDGGESDVFWGWLDAQGRLRLSVGNVSTTNPGTVSASPISDGNWHTVVMTRNAETGEQVMSIDGNITRSMSAPGILGTGTPFNLLGRIQGNPVGIDGQISDVRVFNRVIPETEFALVLNANNNVLAQRQTGANFSLDPTALGIKGTSFIWNFGEEDTETITTTANSPVATHTYGTPGNYIVRVTAINEDGSRTYHAFVQSVVTPPTQRAPSTTTNITGDGRYVYALDPDAGSVTAFDAVSNAKLWQIAVGKDPRTLALDNNGQLWVTVQGEDIYARIKPTTREVEKFNLPYGSAPHGIVFTPDGNLGLMTLAGKSRLVTFNPFTGKLIGEVNLPTGDVRGIAVTADSNTAYVARFRAREDRSELYQIDLSKVARVMQ